MNSSINKIKSVLDKYVSDAFDNFDEHNAVYTALDDIETDLKHMQLELEMYQKRYYSIQSSINKLLEDNEYLLGEKDYDDLS